METIDKQIRDEYLIYEKVSSKLQNMKSIIENPKKRGKVYAVIQELLEQRTFYRYNINKAPYHGYHKIIEGDDSNLIKLFFDTWQQYVNETNDSKEVLNDYNNVTNIKEFFIDIINRFYKNYKYLIKHVDTKINISDDLLTYNNIEIKLDHRLKMLLNRASEKELLYMLLRYINYGITGHHCSLPLNVYEYLYNECNIKAEGFSSPLNSKLIFMPDTLICTLFKDTDEPFGSKGPFSLDLILENSDKNWLCNPPYMESVMKMTYDTICKAFEKIKRKDFLIILLIPKWTNNETYKNASNNKTIMIKNIEIPEKHYMDCNGRMVVMNNVINSMFFFSHDKNLLSQDQYDKLIKIWTTESESKEQSNFYKLDKNH